MIGDVGQNTREEIDVQKASNPGGGENYGWRLREGTIATPTGGEEAPSRPVPSTRFSTIPTSPQPKNRWVGKLSSAVMSITVLACQHSMANTSSAILGLATVANPDSLGRIFTITYDGSNASNFTDITSQLFTGTGFSLDQPDFVRELMPAASYTSSTVMVHSTGSWLQQCLATPIMTAWSTVWISTLSPEVGYRPRAICRPMPITMAS